MSQSTNPNIPYEPRRRRSERPSRPLPAPPPTDDNQPADGTNMDAELEVEEGQGFTSPPSPPPPPPPSNPSGHLHPHRNVLPTSSDTNQQPPTTLTPLRAHYLKKTLVNLQLSHELNLLTDPILGANALGLLGDPFVLPESAKKEIRAMTGNGGGGGELPFLRFLFHQFILPFPFLSTAPPTFWSAKVQPFLSSLLATTGYTRSSALSKEEQALSESLMNKEEKHEMEERKKLWAKVEKHSGLMVGIGVKVVGGEEVVRIGQGDLRRLEEAAELRRRKVLGRHGQGGSGMASGLEGLPPPPPDGAGFEVNVVGVRVVMEKGRVRHKRHEEFLIRTQRPGMGDVYVSRRYGDFKRLADELRLAFPDYPFPPPPPKDKSTTTAAPPQQQGYSYYNPLRAIYGSGIPQPVSPNPSSSSSASTLNPPTSDAAGGTPLSREKNRMTLRAYLIAILSIPHVLDSPILRSFLLSAPTTLTPAEAMDSQRRLEGDAVREEGRRRFREEAEKRIEGLREGLAAFKGDVLSRDGGLRGVFDVVRRVERVEDLPRAEASVLEWGRISLAATIFQIFVASDTGSDTLANLKRLHGLMPYFVLKGILRISNPMAMIRGVLDLFLARPFGGQSLIQRMFSSSLSEDVRLIGEDIEAVSEKIDDPVLCQKIEQFAGAPFEIQEIYRRDAASEGLDLLVVILRSPDMPSLSRPQFQRVFRASRAYKEYKVAQADLEDSDDDMGPESDDAWLFEDLSILLKLWLRKREKEQLLALIFEGVTAELLKDIITIFYAPLAQVYKAANIAESIGDLQHFLNDMIRTVEQVEELSQEDPQRTVQTFIDLVQRHEQSFYTFVHNVHSKGQGLFDSLMSWIELFLSFARDGLQQPIDLEFILPHAGPERQAIMAEVDAVAQYHYRLKIAHEEKIRKRFERSGGAGGSSQEQDEAELLGSVMASLDLGDTAVAEGAEINDEESEEEEYDEDEEEEASETGSVRGIGVGMGNPTVVVEGESGSSTPRSIPPISTPDLVTDPNLPSLSPFDQSTFKKERRESAGSNRSSIDKVRKSLHLRSSSNSDDKEKDKDKDKAVAATDERRIRSSRNASPNPGPKTEKSKSSKKARKARAAAHAEMMVPPETKAVEELRPVFVEILRPLLRPRAIKL